MRDALLVYASNGTINCVIDNNAVASGYSEVDKAAPEIWAKGMDDAYVIPTSMTLSADQSTEAANIYSDIQTLCMESIAKSSPATSPWTSLMISYSRSRIWAFRTTWTSTRSAMMTTWLANL